MYALRHMKLWSCPHCGIVGRAQHRYLSPQYFGPSTDPMDPGPCHPYYVDKYQRHLLCLPEEIETTGMNGDGI